MFFGSSAARSSLADSQGLKSYGLLCLMLCKYKDFSWILDKTCGLKLVLLMENTINCSKLEFDSPFKAHKIILTFLKKFACVSILSHMLCFIQYDLVMKDFSLKLTE